MAKRASIGEVADALQAVAPALIARCRADVEDGFRFSGNFKLTQLKTARLTCLHLAAALDELRRTATDVSRTPEWFVVQELHQALIVSLLSPEDRTPDVRRFVQRALRKRAGATLS